MNNEYFKLYFKVLARQQNIENPGIIRDKIKSSNVLCSTHEDGFKTIELEVDDKITIYINYSDILEWNTLESFLDSHQFLIICRCLKTDIKKILSIGKEYYENYQRNLTNTIDSHYYITHNFVGPTGNEMEVSIDFLRNRFSLKTPTQSLNDTPLRDIVLMDKHDYEDICRELERLKKIIDVFGNCTVTKLDNGYVVNNKYYENLEDIEM